MIGVIDELAAAYSWSKQDILEQVYVDEAVELQGRIRRRRAEERLSALNIALMPWATQKSREDLINHYRGQALSQRGSFSGSSARRPAPENLERAKLAGLKVLIGGGRSDA